MQYYSFPDEAPFRLLIMTDEYKPLIVEGEEVADYNDTTISYVANGGDTLKKVKSIPLWEEE